MEAPPVPSPPLTIPARRRRSPPSSLDTRPKKHSPNQVFVPPASPQVISSLIDSLSAISGPAHDHFENFPSIGSRKASTVESVHSATNGVDSGSHRLSRETSYIYLDDAAEPPVVKTSKPPSGLSPITAPKPPKKERQHSLRDYLGSAAQSSTSLCSVRSAGDDHAETASIGNISIGNVSIEAGPRPDSMPGRSSADSKRSSRGARSLMYMSSRERLKVRESEKRRLSRLSAGPDLFHSDDRLSPRPSPRLPPPKQSLQLPLSPTHQQPQHPQHPPPSPPPEFFAESTIEESHEEPLSPPTPSQPPRVDTKGKSPLQESMSPGPADGRGSPTQAGSPGFIPERQSSLRHKPGSYKRTHSSRSGRHDHVRAKTPIAEESGGETRKEKEDFGGVETETTKRIRELKKQREMRKTIVNDPNAEVEYAGEATGVSHVSPMATPPSPPPSSDSGISDKPPHDPTRKAHKILGLAFVDPFTPLPRKSQSPGRGADGGQNPYTPHLNDAQDDNDEPIPLPINYQLALQTLERQVSTPSTTQSVKTESTSHTLPTPQPTVVGGRSAISRKHNLNLVLPLSPPPESSSRKVSQELASPKPQATRQMSSQSAQSPETGSGTPGRTRSQTQDRHQSLQMSPVRTRSSNEVRGRKKKRWSHPDLPAKALEQDTLLPKRASQNTNAVKAPPQAVKEDRPASSGSIELAVESFLDAPRLSQKVRHPQSGRTISFSEVGDPKGYAVFCCVGMGLTRYVMAFYDELALTLKLRLITPDRPGIGGSQGDENVTPLAWTDDIIAICQRLKITKFSLLAHSAGAVYALAAALRMPQHIRGRVHLLAPWIPPSQMAPIGVRQNEHGGRQLPRAQRFLRVLPPSFLKIANSSFLSATSASITRSMPKSAPAKRKGVINSNSISPISNNDNTSPIGGPGVRPSLGGHRESMMLMDQVQPNNSALSVALRNPADPNHATAKQMQERLKAVHNERRELFDERLTFAIWERATANANPATDLIVCLETRHSIGFRYEDITRGVVIHHGSKDTRVPVDNVRWLGRIMRRCEVRILEGEAHGLMANPIVMGNLLMEISKEWEDWNTVVEGSRDKRGDSS